MTTDPTPAPRAALLPPSPWVARFAPLVLAGEVLDLACGGGRHARHLAALGHPVLAVDRDLQPLQAAMAGRGANAGPSATAGQGADGGFSATAGPGADGGFSAMAGPGADGGLSATMGQGADAALSFTTGQGADGALSAITAQACDLEAPGFAWPFGSARFAGIVVTNYLHRPLMDALVASMKPDGVLIYETFSDGNAQFGKPSNPDFLLRPGELLALATRHGLQVLAFEEGVTGRPAAAVVQRLCACGPEFSKEARVLSPVQGQNLVTRE